MACFMTAPVVATEGPEFDRVVAILVICISTWLLCALLFGVTALLVPRDVERLRETMRARAETEQAVS